MSRRYRRGNGVGSPTSEEAPPFRSARSTPAGLPVPAGSRRPHGRARWGRCVAGKRSAYRYVAMKTAAVTAAMNTYMITCQTHSRTFATLDNDLRELSIRSYANTRGPGMRQSTQAALRDPLARVELTSSGF